ncbi:hypothetical protein [Nonomuraea antimicrobica]|uniref:hypothetical protein n=1 Tax=Nonomuraea antimicrobica TaxID=561173 RepID=UPI0031F0954E
MRRGSAVLGCVLLAGSTACAALRPPPAASPSPPAAETQPDTGTAPSEPEPTPDQDPRSVFLESLRRQAVQPVIATVQEHYNRKDFYPGGSRQVVVSAFDYRSKAIKLEETKVTESGGRSWVSWATRCADGTERFWTDPKEPWEDRGSKCPSLIDPVWINDGLGIGGLTEEQAGIMVDTLAEYKGLIRGDALTTVQRDGKPYLRLDVTVRQIELPGGSEVGAALFGDAVKTADVDVATHPYGWLGGDPALKIVRLVDPDTLLPVYSQLEETAPGWAMRRVQYAFDGPVGTSDLPKVPEIARLTWEPEKSS